jgi:hypothetical protein
MSFSPSAGRKSTGIVPLAQETANDGIRRQTGHFGALPFDRGEELADCARCHRT